MNYCRACSYLLPTRRNWFGWSALVLTVIISVLWLGNTPLHTDDFYYQRIPGPDDETSLWLYDNEELTSFSQVPTAVLNHRININGRVSNAAYLAIQPLPLWVIKYFCGIVLAVLGWLLWRWCGKRSLQNNLCAVAIPLLLWFGMQWDEPMQSSDFQFNYTLPSVFLVGCMMLFLNRHKKPGIGAWLLLAVFSVWHEGFTIIFGVFLGVQWLYRRDLRTFLALCVLIAGALFQLSGGTQLRISSSFYNEHQQFLFPLTLTIGKSWICLVTPIWWLIRRRKVRRPVRKNLDRFCVGLLVSLIPACAMIFLLVAPQRAHWACDVMGILFALSILRTYSNRRFNPVVKVVFLALYAAWGSSLIYWQLRVTKFTNYTIEEIKKGNMVIDDNDGISEVRIPFWMGNMTRLQYSPYNLWEQSSLPGVTSNGAFDTYIILPESLKGTSFDQWPEYDGNTGMRIGGTSLVTRRYDGESYKGRSFMMTFGKPTIATSPIDRLLAYIKAGTVDSISTPMRVNWEKLLVHKGDSLYVLVFERQPRTTIGRPLIGIRELD